MGDVKVVGLGRVMAEDIDEMLEGAKGKYRSLALIGYCVEGDDLVFRCSGNLRRVDANWMLDRVKSMLMAD
jgi:hypothetical protein